MMQHNDAVTEQPGAASAIHVKRKTVVITGVSRGIGLATTRVFLDAGWSVIAMSRAASAPIQHAHLTHVQYDQRDARSIAHAAQTILGLVSHIDALVNNAGVILDSHDDVIDLAKLRATFDVDVFGVVELTEHLLSHMREGSHIVNIDSLYGAFSFPIDDATSTAYRMAKAALNMYTRTLAFRLTSSGFGIIVSSLDPGWVKTDMGNAGATEVEGPDREPEDAANDILTLVSTVTSVDESGHFWRFGKKREW